MDDPSPTLLAALAPLIVLAIAFVAWTWVDILRRPVRHLPRWAWLLVTVVSIPLGGIAYLLVGRGEEQSDRDDTTPPDRGDRR
jgi:hypothetical protein